MVDHFWFIARPNLSPINSFAASFLVGKLLSFPELQTSSPIFDSRILRIGSDETTDTLITHLGNVQPVYLSPIALTPSIPTFCAILTYRLCADDHSCHLDHCYITTTPIPTLPKFAFEPTSYASFFTPHRRPQYGDALLSLRLHCRLLISAHPPQS
jgi:hypothetical protein